MASTESEAMSENLNVLNTESDEEDDEEEERSELESFKRGLVRERGRVTNANINTYGGQIYSSVGHTQRQIRRLSMKSELISTRPGTRVTEMVKYIVVSLALGCVVGGATCVLWTEYFTSSNDECVQNFKYNSYFGGLVRLVRVQRNNTQSGETDADGTLSETITSVIWDTPAWFKYLLGLFEIIYNTCWNLLGVVLPISQECNSRDCIGDHEDSSQVPVSAPA